MFCHTVIYRHILLVPLYFYLILSRSGIYSNTPLSPLPHKTHTVYVLFTSALNNVCLLCPLWVLCTFKNILSQSDKCYDYHILRMLETEDRRYSKIIWILSQRLEKCSNHTKSRMQLVKMDESTIITKLDEVVFLFPQKCSDLSALWSNL